MTDYYKLTLESPEGSNADVNNPGPYMWDGDTYYHRSERFFAHSNGAAFIYTDHPPNVQDEFYVYDFYLDKNEATQANKLVITDVEKVDFDVADNEYEDLLAQIEDLKRQLADRAQGAFKNKLNKIIETFGLVGLQWTQYTPYFNDGDPCVFRVHDLWAISSQETYDRVLRNGIGWIEEYDGVADVPRFRFPPNDVMMRMFGDHTAILYDGENFHPYDYEHG